jgi:hypothetical protein
MTAWGRDSEMKHLAWILIGVLVFLSGYQIGWRAGRDQAYDEVGVTITEMVKENRRRDK